MSSMPESLAESRYGRRPRNRRRPLGYVVIGVLAALLAAGWAAMTGEWTGSVTAELVAFRTGSDNSMTVTFDVYKPRDKAATCRLEVIDRYHDQVGHADVGIPAGKSTTRVTVRVPATARPVAAEVTGCRLGG